jgi:hypothetical protein
MDLPNAVPEAEAARDRINPIVPLLYEAFEAALVEARQFFDMRGRPYDAHLFSHLVRFFVKDWLTERGKSVEYDEGENPNITALALEPLALSGLRFGHEDWDVRIFKAAKSFDESGEVILELPAPGRSVAKQKFYRQQLEFRFDSATGETRLYRLNMVVLWNIEAGGNVRLYLVCPRNGSSARYSVETYWAPLELPIPIPTVPVAETDPDADDLPALDDIIKATGTEKK